MGTPLKDILWILRSRLDDMNASDYKYSDSALLAYVKRAVYSLDIELSGGYTVSGDNIFPALTQGLQELFALEAHILFIKAKKTTADTEATIYKIEDLSISRVAKARELANTLENLQEEKQKLLWSILYGDVVGRTI